MVSPQPAPCQVEANRATSAAFASFAAVNPLGATREGLVCSHSGGERAVESQNQWPMILAILCHSAAVSSNLNRCCCRQCYRRRSRRRSRQRQPQAHAPAPNLRPNQGEGFVVDLPYQMHNMKDVVPEYQWCHERGGLHTKSNKSAAEWFSESHLRRSDPALNPRFTVATARAYTRTRTHHSM